VVGGVERVKGYNSGNDLASNRPYEWANKAELEGAFRRRRSKEIGKTRGKFKKRD